MKNFINQCHSDNIVVESDDNSIRRILRDAMIINVPLTRSNSDKAARKELAAALAWARDRISEHHEWVSLPATMQSTLQGLYQIREDTKRSTAWVKAVSALVAANLTPTPSPVKPTAIVGGLGRVRKSPRELFRGDPISSQQQRTAQVELSDEVADSPGSGGQNPPQESARESWTLQPPFRAPTDYKWCDNRALLEVIPLKRRSILYKGASWERHKLALYQKTMSKLTETKSELVEDATDPLWTHRLAFSYSESSPVDPAKDGLCLKFMAHWESQALYSGDYVAEEDFDRRRERLRRGWSRASAALTSGSSGITNSELDPVLDHIHQILARRADEAEKELCNGGKAGHEIIAGCRRQQLEVKDLFRVYAAQLGESSKQLDRETAGRQANAWYYHLLQPMMQSLLGGALYDPNKDPLVTATEQAGQAAGSKRNLESTLTASGGKKPNLGSLGSVPLNVPEAPPVYWQLPPPPPIAQQPFVGYGGGHSLTSASTQATAVGTWGPAVAAFGGGDNGSGGGKASKGKGIMFVGQPASDDIIGSSLAVWGASRCKNPCRNCPPTGRHASWECPHRYLERLREPCPGFDASGQKLPSAWVGGQLTPKTKAQWKAYIATFGLERAGEAPRAPNFD